MTTMGIRRFRSCSGQSLVETALLAPFLLALAFNAFNFGYFLFVAVNLASTSRTAVEYSIQGNSTPSEIPLPSAGPVATNTSVSYLSMQDLTGAISSPSSKASLQVCSPSVGLTGSGSTQTAKCSQFPSGTYPAPDADPEAPSFVLNQVAVQYTLSPIINGTPFNILVLAAMNCTSSGGSVTCIFQRSAQMRAMN